MQKTVSVFSGKWLLAFVLACMGFSACADGHVVGRAYWQDESGQVDFEHAKNQNYTPYEGVLSRGYTQAAVWIRLSIRPPTDADELVLRIRPVYLDEITLYDPLDTTGKLRRVGDSVDYQDNEYKSLMHTFVIPAGEQPRDVWLRLKTTSTSLINIEAFTPAQMQDNEFHQQLTYFSVLALVAMFMLLVLINWLNYRESLYAFFVVRQVYYFFYTGSLFGLHRYFLSDVMSASSLDLLYSWMVVGATAISFAFEYKFLNEYAPPKWAKAILVGMFIWSLTVMTLLLAGYVSQGMRLNMLLNTLGVLMLLVLAVTFIDDRKTQADPTSSLLRKKVVVGYYLTINLVLMFSVLPYLGWMKGNEFAVNGLVFYTISSGLVMTVLMQYRAIQIRKAQHAFEQELLLSKRQVELEKSRREEQTHLFHMLMHELKNPLAIIDMALLAKNDLQKTSHYVSRAVNNMKAILERCVKADRLTEGNVTVQKQTIGLNEFLSQMLSYANEADSKLILEMSGPLTVRTDAQFFEIMCSNLIDNAMRYGDPMMPVRVQARVKLNADGARGVLITVANRPGAASWPDPQKVFKKYYRSAGAEAQSGTGLGLFLVHTLAKLVGGTCEYVPDETNIKFELWIPS